eukprot:TRINITY_DN58751_c0_g1_i1.p1 TRINITY_DN58751_c0_g1~~TRINITY_DN58751_c0_g1_i1.p1  ORF type:complete len:475 (-),score=113.42 TRINITY_DN58751_c0_g1_i1:169-1593(-)
MMFRILLLAGLGLAAASDESREIILGLTEGFLSEKGDVRDCMKTTEHTVEDVESAVHDLEKKDAADVLAGLRKLSHALKEFPEALRDCKALGADVERVVMALRAIHSPHQFLYHVGKDLIVNHAAIYKEISAAVQDHKAKKFEDFGKQIGLALHKIIIGDQEKFQEFVKLHNKNYSSASEWEARLRTFVDNLKTVYQVQQAEEGSATYSHLSPFADLNPDEFSQRHGLLSPENFAASENVEILDTTDLPSSIDWVEKGAVNPVKNQGACGSCWAFSTVANIEGAGFVSTGKLVSLSEQELVDCDHNGDHGCKGGLPSNAFQDMIKNGLGLEPESAYPYTGRDGACTVKQAKEVAFIKGFKQISTDEDQMAAALVQYGPLSIGLNAGPMQWYMGGVAHPFKLLCNPKRIDHGVAIVGYGVEGTKKYWKIRNSWGTSWGEQGYYRIIRGVAACGLNSMVTTATGIQFKQNSDSIVV